jgi:PAS domain S-box-containing protein
MQTAEIETLFGLLTALVNGAPRQEAARQLARYLGAENLLIFLPDAEVGVLLPAPGFAQTLPEGRSWQAFLASCRNPDPTHATLPFPDAATVKEVVGLADTDGTVLVLLGGTPRLDEAKLLVTLLPLLDAAFRREQARVLAEAEAEIARKAAMEAQALLKALDESRKATQNELRERRRAEADLREQLRLAALQMDVSTALTTASTLPDILRRCAQALVQHLDAAFARIWTLSETGETLELQASAGLYTHLNGPHAHIAVGDFKIGRIARERRPHLTNTVMNDPLISDHEWARREGMVAFAGYPLLVAERLVGVMGIFARQPLSDAVLSAMQSISSAIALGIERAQTEVALKASEERFRTLADQAPIMIWQSDTRGAGIYVNAPWCTFTGLTLEESLGTGWTQAIHPDDRAAAANLWMQALASRTPYQTEFRLRRADGVYRDALVYGSVCSDQNGRFTGYIGTIQDITDQKELERQREALVSMVTHELKTPLTALQGNIQLAERRLRRFQDQLNLQSPEQQTFLEELHLLLTRSQQQVRLQHRLINDLLVISRLQANTLELRLKPCDLVKLVQETVEEQQAAFPRRLFTLELPEQRGEVLVQADRDRLGQVIGNYLTNALKYSSVDKPVHVGLSVENNYARVWVADQGPGLSPEQQQRAWERYYRVPGIRVQSGSSVSLGLGLHICQRIIESHHGHVGVESAPGEGSRFWFTLPLLS